MTSVLNVDEIAAKDGTSPVALTKQVAAKVYYKINQSTPATNDSFGLSSFTDNSAGQFAINLTNAFDSTHYGITATSDNWHTFFGSSPTASSAVHVAGNSSHSSADSVIWGQMTGDLA